MRFEVGLLFKVWILMRKISDLIKQCFIFYQIRRNFIFIIFFSKWLLRVWISSFFISFTSNEKTVTRNFPVWIFYVCCRLKSLKIEFNYLVRDLPFNFGFILILLRLFFSDERDGKGKNKNQSYVFQQTLDLCFLFYSVFVSLFWHFEICHRNFAKLSSWCHFCRTRWFSVHHELESRFSLKYRSQKFKLIFLVDEICLFANEIYLFKNVR